MKLQNERGRAQNSAVDIQIYIIYKFIRCATKTNHPISKLFKTQTDINGAIVTRMKTPIKINQHKRQEWLEHRTGMPMATCSPGKPPAKQPLVHRHNDGHVVGAICSAFPNGDQEAVRKDGKERVVWANR